ncbi:hypothetical protein [uncultured Moraxella sp.]|uniref:hypothetical protein n=1 Tax=uncultured Moraxella sp. TaxID=263769 RepID=UPI0025CBEE7B|nr:hypothetical protein [uncultured Moraxella sp.]
MGKFLLKAVKWYFIIVICVFGWKAFKQYYIYGTTEATVVTKSGEKYLGRITPRPGLPAMYVHDVNLVRKCMNSVDPLNIREFRNCGKHYIKIDKDDVEQIFVDEVLTKMNEREFWEFSR